LDYPKKEPEYELTDLVDGDGSRVVNVRYYCSSRYKAWYLIAVGWNTFLLLCATILAFQMRGLSGRKFGESTTLAFLIYSHFVFVVVRLITYFLSSVSEWLLARCRSLIFSADMIMTILIYFLPKLFGADNSESGMGSHTFSNMLVSSHIEPQVPPVIRWISNLSSISHYLDEQSVSSVQAVTEDSDPDGSTENKNNVGELSDLDEGSCSESCHLPVPAQASVSALELQQLRSMLEEQNETISLLRNENLSLKENCKCQRLTRQDMGQE